MIPKNRMPSVKPIHAAESTGGFADRFLGIASGKECADFMRYGVTRFGLQGTINITPETRKKAEEWFGKHLSDGTHNQSGKRITTIALNQTCTKAALKKIVQFASQSPDAYDADLIASLMMVQTWQQNRADEDECHLPLKYVAFDGNTPTAFAAISIYIRDQPQALATYITCVMDMLVVDAGRMNEGFDIDLSIACAKSLFDVVAQIYRTLPENRTVVTDVVDEMDSEDDRAFVNHVSQAILDSWEQSRTEEQITRRNIVLEKPLLNFGYEAISTGKCQLPRPEHRCFPSRWVEVVDDDFNF